MTLHLHKLTGCAPTPLASYLKALGILRLVGEQADPEARGWWEGEQFILMTAFSKDDLEAFFLQSYEPTPLLSPWNKGCGFFKSNDPGLSPIEKSTAVRFGRFRAGTTEARKQLDQISVSDAAIRALKARTKTTPKAFQTTEQRKLLSSDTVYRDLLQQLCQQLDLPTLSDATKAEIKRDIHVIESLTTDTSRHATRQEAETLKADPAYKRLVAALDRRFKSLKATLIPTCRRVWRGPHAEWISAAVVLDEAGNPSWPSLLGTGGNDGNLDFTNNFMQQLVALFDTASHAGSPSASASTLLRESLWRNPDNNLATAAIGQYQPGSAGGANSSTGFSSGNLVNSWDFVLMMEGAILFSACATKTLDPIAASRASAPFAVRPHAAGFATPGAEKAQRGEQWMPLWSQPATLNDIAALFGEARIQIQRKTANRPIDMARAINRLGAARGIDSFVRFGYLERNGQSTLAVGLGRISVPKRQNPSSYLVDDLAPWLDRLQLRSRDKNAPARLAQCERNLANAVFAALTHEDSPDRWQAILLAAAEIESLQAIGTAIDAGPIPGLRPEWIDAILDGSAEVRLAIALGSAAAGYARDGRPIDSVRSHILPLETGGRRFKTAEKRLVNDPRVVVSLRAPLRDLAAILDRRLIESGMKGERRSRLVSAAGCGARLDDLAQFIAGTLDLAKLFGLARAFMAIRWDQWRPNAALRSAIGKETPDDSWLSLRIACLPWPLSGDIDIPADLRIVRLLVAGDTIRAATIANQRLRSAGFRPPIQAAIADSTLGRLWAAALVFPIHRTTALRAAAILDPSKKGLIHA